MRHRIIALTAITLILVSAAGPALAIGKFRIGAEGGVNFAWMSAKGADSKVGFTGGILAAYHPARLWSVKTGLLYTRLGGSFDSYSEYYDLVTSSSLTLDYLQIPLLAQVSLPLVGHVAPALYTGPSLFLKTDANAFLETRFDSLDADIVNAKKSYWGWAFGGSLGLVSGPADIFLDIRFTLGLESFLRAPDIEPDPDSEVNLVDPDYKPLNLKHHAIAIMVGAAF